MGAGSNETVWLLAGSGVYRGLRLYKGTIQLQRMIETH
jgi:hypothetical protein